MDPLDQRLVPLSGFSTTDWEHLSMALRILSVEGSRALARAQAAGGTPEEARWAKRCGMAASVLDELLRRRGR